MDPASLYILRYPERVLRERAREVPSVTEEVRAVAKRMIELMFEAEGIGLAAPQVGLSWRMFVAHVPPTEDRSVESDPPTATVEPVVYINPVLSDPRGELIAYEEGCLSLPEVVGEVLRPEHITITATDLKGERFTRSAAGLLARCWQHEFDHLEGVLIIDRMTQMSRLKNRAAVRRLEKSARL
ncbi:MAG: peptide deformylase [Phycisphaeraceae bacterium]|nr:peptide deformylase [Phycisphaeraceae bacterium]